MNDFYIDLNQNIIDKAKLIKMLILDVDGVLSDGKIYNIKHNEIKSFNTLDGFGIVQIQNFGILTAIITGNKSKNVKYRASKLKINFYKENVDNKKIEFLKLLKQVNINQNECAYIGDDITDLPVLNKVGLSISVPNAHIEVKKTVDYITKASAGHGAVREVCDILLYAQNKYFQLLKNYT